MLKITFYDLIRPYAAVSDVILSIRDTEAETLALRISVHIEKRFIRVYALSFLERERGRKKRWNICFLPFFLEMMANQITVPIFPLVLDKDS